MAPAQGSEHVTGVVVGDRAPLVIERNSSWCRIARRPIRSSLRHVRPPLRLDLMDPSYRRVLIALCFRALACTPQVVRSMRSSRWHKTRHGSDDDERGDVGAGRNVEPGIEDLGVGVQRRDLSRARRRLDRPRGGSPGRAGALTEASLRCVQGSACAWAPTLTTANAAGARTRQRSRQRTSVDRAGERARDLWRRRSRRDRVPRGCRS